MCTGGKVGTIYHLGLPSNSSTTMIPDVPTQSKAGMLMLYENPATLDQRIQKGQEVFVPTDPTAIAKAYVGKWLPPTNSDTYLTYNEMDAIINGDEGSAGSMRSYSHDITVELYRDPIMQGEFSTVDAMEQWLKEQVDGNLNNAELCTSQDSFVWRGALGVVGFYGGATCGSIQDNPGSQGMQNLRTILETDALVATVKTHPEWYGGVSGGVADLDKDPTWATLDQTPVMGYRR